MPDATARFLGLSGARSLAAVPAVGGGDVVYTLLRVGTGLLFLQHGLPKLFGMLGGFMGTPGATAPLFSQMGLAGVLEFGGGILLVAGLLTRPVAFILAIEMIAAFFIAHYPRGGWPIQNGGELPLLFALIFVLLAWNGSGRLSLDRLLARRVVAAESPSGSGWRLGKAA